VLQVRLSAGYISIMPLGTGYISLINSPVREAIMLPPAESPTNMMFFGLISVLVKYYRRPYPNKLSSKHRLENSHPKQMGRDILGRVCSQSRRWGSTDC
jgi:hypothetical protein